jgi:ABC-type Na+ efflux pump permease subunit
MKLWRENDDIRILKASQERNIYDIMSSINQSTVQSVQNNESKILKENKRTINNSNSLVSSSTNQSNINKQVLQYKKKGNNTNNIGNTTTSSFNKPINQNVKQGKVLDKK